MRGHGGVAKDNRGFVNSVWSVAKTGIPWRDWPERFGKWDTAFHRFNEWCKKGSGGGCSRPSDFAELLGDGAVHRHHTLAKMRTFSGLAPINTA